MKPHPPPSGRYRRLGLALVPLHDREDRGDVGVEITIDGKPLIALVRDVETRFGADPAGAYWAASLENLWLIEERDDGRWVHASPGSLGDQGFAPLLVCDCGDPECWGLYADVRADGDTVSWSGFVSTVSRRHNRAHYKGLDPLLFERKAHFKVLARLEPGIGSVVRKRNVAWADAKETRRRARGRV